MIKGQKTMEIPIDPKNPDKFKLMTYVLFHLTNRECKEALDILYNEFEAPVKQPSLTYPIDGARRMDNQYKGSKNDRYYSD